MPKTASEYVASQIPHLIEAGKRFRQVDFDVTLGETPVHRAIDPQDKEEIVEIYDTTRKWERILKLPLPSSDTSRGVGEVEFSSSPWKVKAEEGGITPEGDSVAFAISYALSAPSLGKIPDTVTVAYDTQGDVVHIALEVLPESFTSRLWGKQDDGKPLAENMAGCVASHTEAIERIGQKYSAEVRELRESKNNLFRVSGYPAARRVIEAFVAGFSLIDSAHEILATQTYFQRFVEADFMRSMDESITMGTLDALEVYVAQYLQNNHSRLQTIFPVRLQADLREDLVKRYQTTFTMDRHTFLRVNGEEKQLPPSHVYTTTVGGKRIIIDETGKDTKIIVGSTGDRRNVHFSTTCHVKGGIGHQNFAKIAGSLWGLTQNPGEILSLLPMAIQVV